MKLSFLIVNKKQHILSKIAIYLLLIGWGVTLVLFLEGNNLKEIMFTISLILTVSFFLVVELIAKKKKGYSIDGSVNLSTDGIQIMVNDEQIHYSFDELNSIVFQVDETNCDPNPRGTLNRKKEGINNSIELRTRNEDYLKFMIYIDSANEIEKLDAFLKELNDERIFVKRNGETVKSIKEAHYRDYPLHYKDTRRNGRAK